MAENPLILQDFQLLLVCHLENLLFRTSQRGLFRVGRPLQRAPP
jgi:hypothetical protein